ncbi:hypothetical protein PILCRDRAFT_323235 [Piloderma croceum F 1598]|uniref:Uncharacterized protein n=1 Tax=Piloderma croceum (strain F 1598) TaxID=765440 RepID=A0A0C3G3C3_PILCF|nr:hypothetical protein PILCRDRAFT_323235 [Piloderma croceum F 1598]
MSAPQNKTLRVDPTSTLLESYVPPAVPHSSRCALHSHIHQYLLQAVTYAGVPEALATRTAASTIVGKRTRTNTKAMEKATRAMALNEPMTRPHSTNRERTRRHLQAQPKTHNQINWVLEIQSYERVNVKRVKNQNANGRIQQSAKCLGKTVH